MRRTSPPQELRVSGRRGCAGAKGRRKGDVGSVWEVVSSLASALTEARDQLVTLINKSNGAATRMTGGSAASSGACARHPPRASNSPYPGAGASWVRNVHRGHAHGHVAFGCSSEYRLHPTPVRVKTPQPPLIRVVVTPPPEPKRLPRRCTHPLHRMHHLRGGSSPRARCSPCEHASERTCASRQLPCSPRRRNTVSPDPRRHCIGTQYAALLREESFRMRERRMMDRGCRGRRLPWGND